MTWEEKLKLQMTPCMDKSPLYDIISRLWPMPCMRQCLESSGFLVIYIKSV